MRDVFLKQLVEIAEGNKDIVLITGDLGFKVLDEFQLKFPKQFLNAGIAEQNMIGLATGMALEGKIVFCYSIANFPSLRCLEQIRNDACYHNANVKIVSIGAGFSYGSLGISHHATEDISILRAIPGITVVSPGCDWEVQESTKAIINTPGTAYLRLDRASAGNTKLVGETFKLGKARVVKEGSDVTLVTTGGILSEVLKAAEVLEKQNISTRVINVHTVKPLDLELLVEAVNETEGMIVVEEHTVDGGLGGAVAENLLEADYVPGFFKRVGLKSEFSSVVGSQDYLREYYKISSKYIVGEALKGLAGVEKKKKFFG